MTRKIALGTKSSRKMYGRKSIKSNVKKKWLICTYHLVEDVDRINQQTVIKCL
jgi:hypothetical protein